MLNLVPIDFGYKISTTDLQLIYTESGGVKIEVNAISLENPEYKRKILYRNVELLFPIVAEAKCVTMNFYEYNYSLMDRKLKPLTGFYEVANSQYLLEKEEFDTHKRFDLRHYIVAGNDGYVELIASSQYLVNEKPICPTE